MGGAVGRDSRKGSHHMSHIIRGSRLTSPKRKRKRERKKKRKKKYKRETKNQAMVWNTKTSSSLSSFLCSFRLFLLPFSFLSKPLLRGNACRGGGVVVGAEGFFDTKTLFSLVCYINHQSSHSSSS